MPSSRGCLRGLVSKNLTQILHCCVVQGAALNTPTPGPGSPMLRMCPGALSLLSHLAWPAQPQPQGRCCSSDPPILCPTSASPSPLHCLRHQSLTPSYLGQE